MIEVGPEHTGERLDVFLAGQLPDISRTLIQKLAEERRVTVNGSMAKSGQRVRHGDEVIIDLVLPPALSASAEAIDLPLVYEDGSVAVIDKPAGLVVHPAPGHTSGTLVNALVNRYPELAGSEQIRPGLVHRLDKDTSGLMVVALNAKAQMALTNQLKERKIKREYIALVSGHPAHTHFTIDLPVGRDANVRRRMAAGPHTISPRPAITHVITSEAAGPLSLLRVRLDTGRTHQIRVHLAYIGHPVAGDKLYGGIKVPGLDRQFLHATALEFTSPDTGTAMRFDAPLPDDLRRVLDAQIEASHAMNRLEATKMVTGTISPVSDMVMEHGDQE